MGDDGEQYRERYGKNALGRGWQSFDHRGAHFIGPVNVGAEGGLGKLGNDQLAWVEKDLKARSFQHAARYFCAHSAVDCVSEVELGN